MSDRDEAGPAVERREEPPETQTKPPPPRWLVYVWTAATVVLAAWLFRIFTTDTDEARPISYSSFLDQLTAGEVASVTISDSEIRGRLQRPVHITVVSGEEAEVIEFRTYVPPFGDDRLLGLLGEHDVEVVTTAPEKASRWWTFLLTLSPLLLLLALWMFLVRRFQARGGGFLSMGQSGAQLYDRRREKTTFADVAGAKGPKAELREIVEFLREPERFRRLGAEIPKGVLLVGPPGTGKTLLARAVAGEADVPVYIVTGSAFMEMFVGVGPKRVRDLFESAKASAPSIIFIDELDAIGGARGGLLTPGQDERERTLNQLLAEMDGFEPTQNVIVMSATNRPDVLDPALLRPGRFDRRIVIDLPTTSERSEILALHARKKPLAKDVDLATVARGTPGFSGAALKNLLNEAALTAARKGRDQIHAVDIDDARDRILMGLEREGLALTREELRLLAYHEAGHALLAAVLPHTDPVHKVTIVPRGRAMGATHQLPTRERYIYERAYMLDRITVMMGGRAAEEVVLETVTSGAEDDLRQATALARRMVLDWGMSERVGLMATERRGWDPYLGEALARPSDMSDETAREVDEAIREIIEECHGRAVSTLREHRGSLDRIATRLLEEEEITGRAVTDVIQGEEEAPPAEPAPVGEAPVEA